MNRTTAIAIGVVVLLIGVGVAALPILLPGGTNMSVTFLDADGNEVWVERTGNVPFSFVNFAFVNVEGAEIVSVRVDITWVVTGVDDVNALSGSGSGEIGCFLNTITSGHVKTTTDSFTMSKFPEGTYSKTFQLSDLITVESTGKANGWSLLIDYDLTVTEGTETTDTSLHAGVRIDWTEEALQVVGTIDVS
jgi:hypothetical protein